MFLVTFMTWLTAIKYLCHGFSIDVNNELSYDYRIPPFQRFCWHEWKGAFFFTKNYPIIKAFEWNDNLYLYVILLNDHNNTLNKRTRLFLYESSLRKSSHSPLGPPLTIWNASKFKTMRQFDPIKTTLWYIFCFFVPLAHGAAPKWSLHQQLIHVSMHHNLVLNYWQIWKWWLLLS